MSTIFTLKDILTVLKKRIYLIVIVVILFTGVAALYSYLTVKPIYNTSTTLFIGKSSSDGQSDYSSNDVVLYRELMGTYAGLVGSEDLINRALINNNIDASSRQILGNLTIKQVENSQFLQLSIKTGDKYLGVDVLDAITSEFIKTSKELIPNGLISVVNTPKVPEGSINRGVKTYSLMGFLIGCIFGICLSIIFEVFDNSIKSIEDIEKEIGIPILGTIPVCKDKKEASKKNVGGIKYA